MSTQTFTLTSAGQLEGFNTFMTGRFDKFKEAIDEADELEVDTIYKMIECFFLDESLYEVMRTEESSKSRNRMSEKYTDFMNAIEGHDEHDEDSIDKIVASFLINNEHYKSSIGETVAEDSKSEKKSKQQKRNKSACTLWVEANKEKIKSEHFTDKDGNYTLKGLDGKHKVNSKGKELWEELSEAEKSPFEKASNDLRDEIESMKPKNKKDSNKSKKATKSEKVKTARQLWMDENKDSIKNNEDLTDEDGNKVTNYQSKTKILWDSLSDADKSHYEKKAKELKDKSSSSPSSQDNTDGKPEQSEKNSTKKSEPKKATGEKKNSKKTGTKKASSKSTPKKSSTGKGKGKAKTKSNSDDEFQSPETSDNEDEAGPASKSVKFEKNDSESDSSDSDSD